MTTDPFRIDKGRHTTIGNSGGKTSGYNLWRHLQSNGGGLPKRTRCVFTNTGWEHPQTLDFLAEQARRWSVEVVWLEFCRRPATVEELDRLEGKWQKAQDRLADFTAKPTSVFSPKRPAKGKFFGLTAEGVKREVVRKAGEYATSCYHSWRKAGLIGTDTYRIVTRDTASTDGRPYEEMLEGLLKFREEVKDKPGVLPNSVQRLCTGYLKIRLVAQYMDALFGIHKNFDSRLGLRADEEERVKSADSWGNDGGHSCFPLYEAGVDKAEVAAFWAGQPFGLGLKAHEGNCGGCYMKRRAVLVDLIRRGFFDPAWWRGWEEKTGQQFRQDRSYRGLEMAAQNEPQMFRPDDLDNGITCESGYCSN